MFPIKLDRPNIILLAVAFLLAVGSIVVPIPAGGFFPFVLAIILIAYIRSIYLVSGKNVAIKMALIFLLIPLVLYALYYTLTSNSTTLNTIGKILIWIIIVFASVLGLRILYIAVRVVVASVSPETNNKIELRFIERDVKRHFRFLLERGYRISHLEYVPHHYAGWHLQLDAPNDEFSIVLDEQERPLLVFGKVKTDQQSQIFLEAMVYYLTDKKVFIENSYNSPDTSRSQEFNNTAKLLRTYIVQIENYSRNDSKSTRNELSTFQEQYIDLLVQESERQFRTDGH